MQKYGAEPDRGPVHEYEFARHGNRASLLERPMDPNRFAPAVLRRLDAVGETAHPIVQQRSIDEARPDIEHVDQFPIEPLETPGLIRVNDEISVSLQEAVIEIDHAADELRGEDADAAVVEEIDAGSSPTLIEHRVIAEMRIAVDHAEAAERPPPGSEHRV